MSLMAWQDLAAMELVAIIIGGALILFNWLENRSARRSNARREENEAKHKERELKQLRDHQLNHGRRVFNWLESELKRYGSAAHGIQIEKDENNGGMFSIFVRRRDDGVMQGYTPVLQLDYDFMELTKPYLGHIHYGAYGSDILIWVGDHAPYIGLNQLVIDQALDRAEA